MNVENLVVWRWVITEPKEGKPVVEFPTKEGADKFMTESYVNAGYKCFPVYREEYEAAKVHETFPFVRVE